MGAGQESDLRRQNPHPYHFPTVSVNAIHEIGAINPQGIIEV